MQAAFNFFYFITSLIIYCCVVVYTFSVFQKTKEVSFLIIAIAAILSIIASFSSVFFYIQSLLGLPVDTTVLFNYVPKMSMALHAIAVILYGLGVCGVCRKFLEREES
ncbi:MAG: hypothetical protein JNK65_05270 [Deltaproteobacteria bacterium]|nr:hypothetical protein [Deltaproteobacteria bacterium]